MHPKEIKQELEKMGVNKIGVTMPEGFRYTAPFISGYHFSVLNGGYYLRFAKIWGIVKPKNYLVIGVLLGTTESYSIQSTGHHPRRIVACDVDLPAYNPDQTNLAAAYENIAGSRYAAFKGELIIIKSDSAKTDAHTKLGPYDLTFVDGEHCNAAVMRDMTASKRALSKGGIILVHDLDLTTSTVRQGFDNWMASNPDMECDRIESKYFHLGLGVAWRRVDF